MDAQRIREELLLARDGMELDEEIFGFLLYHYAGTGFVEGVDEEGFKIVMSALDGLGRRKGHKLTAWEKRSLREFAMELLGKELMSSGFSLKHANMLAADKFGVAAIQWCRMDEIGEMIRDLRLMKGTPRPGKDGQVKPGEAIKEGH